MDARVIPLEEAVRIALENNSALRRAENTAALGAVGVSEARLAFVPTFNVSAVGLQAYEHRFSTKNDADTESASIGAAANITLFDGFRDIKRLQIAKLAAAAGDLNLARLREATALTTIAQFLALTQSQRQLSVQQQNLAAALELKRQIEIYVETGDRPRADLYTQQSAAAAASLSVVDAERGIQLARMELIDTLQLDPVGSYDFQPPEAQATAALAEPQNTAELDALIQRALERRDDIKAQQAVTELTEKSVSLARPSRWPMVSLGAGYGSSYLGPVDDLAPGFQDQLDANRRGTVALNVTVPLFNFDSSRLAVRRARLQLANSRIDLQRVVKDVELQVRRAWLDYTIARERYKVIEVQQQTAQLALETSKERYQIGAATLVELSQARASYLQSESALVSARYALLYQRLALDYTTGDLNSYPLLP